MKKYKLSKSEQQKIERDERKRKRIFLKSSLSPKINKRINKEEKGTYESELSNENEEINDMEINEKESQELANILDKLYIRSDKEKHYEIFTNEEKEEFIKKFELEGFNFNKDILFPSTLINCMTRLNYLEISNLEINEYNTNIYKSYVSNKLKSYLLLLLDSINIKTLYIINIENKYYISPLNIRKFRNTIRKSKEKIEEIEINKEIKERYKIKENKKISIDTREYDIICMMNGYEEFYENEGKIEVDLLNFDINRDFKSCILGSNPISGKIGTGHIISINKCYDYKILNTTWEPFNMYDVNGFKSGENTIYYLDITNKLVVYNPEEYIESENKEESESEEIVDEDEEKEERERNKKIRKYILKNKIEKIYISKFIVNQTLNETFKNIHIFSTKKDKKIGGTHINEIPKISKCYSIYYPNNLLNFCWFSSIINSLFFADDISIILINKVMRYIEGTLEYINRFCDEEYKIFDKDNIIELKKYITNLIYLFTYIYCSYNILSKNQINLIKNKKKWKEIYYKIINNDNIFLYVLALSNPK